MFNCNISIPSKYLIIGLFGICFILFLEQSETLAKAESQAQTFRSISDDYPATRKQSSSENEEVETILSENHLKPPIISDSVIISNDRLKFRKESWNSNSPYARLEDKPTTAPKQKITALPNITKVISKNCPKDASKLKTYDIRGLFTSETGSIMIYNKAEDDQITQLAAFDPFKPIYQLETDATIGGSVAINNFRQSDIKFIYSYENKFIVIYDPGGTKNKNKLIMEKYLSNTKVISVSLAENYKALTELEPHGLGQALSLYKADLNISTIVSIAVWEPVQNKIHAAVKLEGKFVSVIQILCTGSKKKMLCSEERTKVKPTEIFTSMDFYFKDTYKSIYFGWLFSSTWAYFIYIHPGRSDKIPLPSWLDDITSYQNKIKYPRLVNIPIMFLYGCPVSMCDYNQIDAIVDYGNNSATLFSGYHYGHIKGLGKSNDIEWTPLASFPVKNFLLQPYLDAGAGINIRGSATQYGILIKGINLYTFDSNLKNFSHIKVSSSTKEAKFLGKIIECAFELESFVIFIREGIFIKAVFNSITKIIWQSSENKISDLHKDFPKQSDAAGWLSGENEPRSLIVVWGNFFWAFPADSFIGGKGRMKTIMVQIIPGKLVTCSHLPSDELRKRENFLKLRLPQKSMGNWQLVDNWKQSTSRSKSNYLLIGGGLACLIGVSILATQFLTRPANKMPSRRRYDYPDESRRRRRKQEQSIRNAYPDGVVPRRAQSLNMLATAAIPSTPQSTLLVTKSSEMPLGNEVPIRKPWVPDVTKTTKVAKTVTLGRPTYSAKAPNLSRPVKSRISSKIEIMGSNDKGTLKMASRGSNITVQTSPISGVFSTIPGKKNS